MLKCLISNKIKKRDDGETVLTLFPIIVSAVILLALVVIFSTWIANVDKKVAVDQVIRKYALRLETEGYLTSGQLGQLEQELKDAGMTNINCKATIDGQTTTIEKQSYGTPIYLAVTGEITLNDPSLINGKDTPKKGIIAVVRGTNVIKLSYLKSTTSKISKDPKELE